MTHFTQANERLRILSLCREHGMELDDHQADQLEQYAVMLSTINRSVNLVSRKEEASLLLRHVFHSLLIGLYYPFRPEERVLDLGTGGGLPGIPLAIAFPETNFLLIDATGKKIRACREMITKLGLSNVHAKKTRAEELKGMVFDTVLSRQVAPLKTLCSYAERLLTPEGLLICLKGGDLSEEIDAARAAAAANHGFPADITTHRIGHFDPCFAEKSIVIAYR
ncbi:16S rRNA (guanine(527)-N(7))-methyltransferase RsmG [Prosthecochloris sp. N3]|uniref:Ribosomal RNA small subunit methyltransferase G n=1 Tax=Prosthecochloris ethylica TaxID=2743976 RepID=A0ABR9XP14_9CHLB|nr:16S rRNA (guanine(527)-N(7))-methyltransferase RsmG [Prosthecochloris ethylica]MBF0585838.1 16S rRNA (guanine(527)-N(7))-methyltransferase RsmG [Prosthecochloris ethylica]MBF0635748.1 16S rRNA (guanine(527)-N(7))-methyltransferase RsmG [Prosthecochloris ethylica]NUK47046.1 16S rRNA (guanine(527)-N(7))-methyltransferase RsmG [Prosthecochloris ethylica]